MVSWEEQPLPRSFDSVFYGAAGGGVELPSDDQFNRVSFLSHFDGTNNGVNNVFDDGSTSNHTITTAGNVTQGSFGPFARPDGDWGVSFDGSGDYLSSANSSDWALANGAFTIEAWLFMEPSGSVKQSIIGHWTNGSRGWQARTEPSGSGYKLRWTWTTDGSSDSSYTGSIVAAFNTWNHVAWVRSSNTITLYVNGVAGGTVSGVNIYAPNTPLVIGDWDSNAADFNGVISNLRLVKGTAVYTGNFTPSTSKLTAITNTKLLTCQSNRFVDNSGNAHTVTPSGNPAVTAFGPFLTSEIYSAATNGASAYFDGTADALSISAVPISASGNFTLEGWVYSNSASEQAIVGQYQGRSTGRMIITTGSGLLIFFQNGVTGGNNGSSVALGQWAHFVLQRTGSNIAFYVNGARILNNSAGNIAQDYLVIGTEDVNSGNYPNTFDGYISNIRVTSSAVYSEGTSITVPTAPYTTVTNTNLLLNMADAQAIDQVAKSNIALEGNAVTSTAQKKIGTASFYSPGGDGDKGLINTSGGALLPDYNWTIEVWTYCTNSAANQVVFAQGLSGGGGRVALGIEGSVYLLQIGSAKAAHNARTLNQWVHLCATYDGTNAKLFIDGTLASSGSVSFSTATDQNLQAGIGSLGTGWDTSAYGKWYGYIDELRVSRFIRHTGNFTPDTEPFADKGQDA